MVYKTCKKQPEPIDPDLWIQALIFFRDNRETENEIKKSLEIIRRRNILSPLLVLSILKEKKSGDTKESLKFGLISHYLLEFTKTQNKRIKKH